MPELPEVETVRQGLAPVFEGARIERLDLRRKDLRFPFPPGFRQRLEGRTVTALARRAKYLLFHLDDGAAMISHLGMSGSYRIETDGGAMTPGVFHHARGADGPHDHVVFHLRRPDAPDARVIFNDPRRFGFMLLAEPGMIGDHPAIAALGIEPTGNALSGTVLAQLFAGKRAPLKAALLDQRLVAGLGNIYVCEALWRAKLSPRRQASTLARKDGGTTARAEALAVAIRETIADAIAAGGSSLRDYRQADGSLGYFQHSFSVYDREGEACPRCDGVVLRMVQSGRSTFYCPSCQR